MKLAFCLLMAGGLTAQKPNTISVSTGDNVIAQFVDGAGWKTLITLVNMDNVPASFVLRVYEDGGQPMAVDFIGTGRTSLLSGTLPIKGLSVIETAGVANGLSQGWAQIETSQYVNGNAVFRQRVEGRPDFEAVVPFSSYFDDAFVLPFDNRDATTAMALVNPYQFAPSQVTVAFFDEAGERFHLEQLTLQPRQHLAFALGDRFPQSRARRGTVEFTTTRYVSGLGIRFLGAAFTSIHTIHSFRRP